MKKGVMEDILVARWSAAANIVRRLAFVGIALGSQACGCGPAEVDGARAAAVTKACVDGEARGCSGPVAHFTDACDGGSHVGCVRLGELALEGRGGAAKDEARAAALFTKACEARSTEGCLGLARLLEEGRGVDRDEARAASLHTRECDTFGQLKATPFFRPYAASCFHLGRMFEEGRGTGKNGLRAVALFDKACAGGEERGCARRGALPKEVIQRVLEGARRDVRACFEGGLREIPRPAGRVASRFVIGRDGKVLTADFDGSEVPDHRVLVCLTGLLQGLSFPPPEPEGSLAVVDHPFQLTP